MPGPALHLVRMPLSSAPVCDSSLSSFALHGPHTPGGSSQISGDVPCFGFTGTSSRLDWNCGRGGILRRRSALLGNWIRAQAGSHDFLLVMLTLTLG